MLMRNKHPRIATFAWYMRSVKPDNRVRATMRANSILVETHGFLIATIPGIRPVLLQKKQVDQADATNGRLWATWRWNSKVRFNGDRCRQARSAG